MGRRSLVDTRNMYKRVFGSEDGKEVLAELRKFCFATSSLAVQDENKSVDVNAMLIHEGRRQVFMQIINTLKVVYEDIYDYELTEYGDD